MDTTEITRTEQVTDGLDTIVWTLIEDGVEIAHLDAHVSGLILNVEVDDDRRGEGHARHLFEHADADLGLYHAPSWGRTPEGQIFADAMGGERACEILGLDLDTVTNNYA